MHSLGLVFVREPTKEAVQEAMAPHFDTEWDWYRCGGRWDGLLQGKEEMKRRETDNGFNFDPKNDDPERNSVLAHDLPVGLPIPYFFVAPDGDWLSLQHWDKYAKSRVVSGGYGDLVDSPHYEERFRKALREYPDYYVVVIDVHD